MPLIDLTPEMLGPERDRWPLAYLEAVMLWPDRPDHRARSLLAALAAYLIDSTKRYVNAEKPLALAFHPGNGLEMLTLIANAPPISDIQETTKTPFARGVISGRIFLETLHAKKTGRNRNLQQIKHDVIGHFSWHATSRGRFVPR